MVKKLVKEPWRLSSYIHAIIYGGQQPESLCSRAYRLHTESLFWYIWMRLFTVKHCKESYEYWYKTHEESK